MSTAQDVLNVARSQLGVGENPPGSNRGTPYHAWYGAESQGWQWCAIFVSWVIWHVDPDLFYRLKTAYSGDFLNVGRRYGREIDLSQIAPGDICIWDRPVGGITDHIGFVESVTGSTFNTIEGNSGDCVKRNTHAKEQTSACHYYFVRPNHSSTPTPVKKQEDEMAMYDKEGASVFFGDCFVDKYNYFLHTNGDAGNVIFHLLEHSSNTERESAGQSVHKHQLHDLQNVAKTSQTLTKGSYALTCTADKSIKWTLREVPK